MKDREKILEEFGLSKNKAKVYLTLLKFGSSTAEKIAKNSGVHRRNVYDTLEGLIKIGLVSYISKDKRKYYKATNPYHLLDILKEEREKLKRKELSISSILSELLHIKELPKEENFVTIHKGVEGIKAIFNDILETKKENLVLSAHKPPEPFKDYLNWFHKRRVKLKIPEKLLVQPNDKERAMKLSKLPLTQIKFLSKSSYGKTAINIYDGKVAIIMWSEPVVILIENKEISESFRSYFKMLWKLKK